MNHSLMTLSIKKSMLSLLVLLLTVTWSGELSAETTQQYIYIELPESYTVTSQEAKTILLGDLSVSIMAPDQETQKKFESLEVLDAPQPGEIVRLPNHYIIRSIRKAMLDFANVRFKGERMVEVYGYGKSINLKTVIAQIQEEVLMETGWKEDELILRVLSTPTGDLWVPKTENEIVLSRTSPMVYGTVRYEVRIFTDNVLYKSFPVVVTSTHRRIAYMPTRNLKRGDVIGPKDIREVVQYFDKELTDRMAVDDIKEIIGAKSKTQIHKGDLIKWNNLDVNYVVNRGDNVKMVIRNGGMSMQTSGKALNRGAVGDIVPIKTVQTNQVVKARIIQRGVVELVSS